MSKIKAGELLVKQHLVQSSKEAQALILSGCVYCRTKKIEKFGEVVSDNAELVVKKKERGDWVSRGALKLEHVIKKYNISIEDKVCMDIGSSTGGFTQVLYNGNAKKIYAVDVGYNELDYRLRKIDRIVVLERTNARYIPNDVIVDMVDIMVCDVSFISCIKVINPNLKFLELNSLLIILVKPEFKIFGAELIIDYIG